ncbi:MAG: hypothetical protein RQ736_00515 [Thiogranum sp.]|nr:hypothetical protein [Thiogranum sp.]
MKLLTSILACSLLFLSGCGDQTQDTAETEPMFEQDRSTAEMDRETPQTREPRTDMGAMESEPIREEPGTTMQDTEGTGTTTYDSTQTP